MKLSTLQKFILKECLGERGKIAVKKFLRFYQNQSKIPSKLEQVKIISKSVDRLINKGLLVGFGEKTQHKWFIKEVRLTRAGRLLAKKLQGEQVSLPFKKALLRSCELRRTGKKALPCQVFLLRKKPPSFALISYGGQARKQK